MTKDMHWANFETKIASIYIDRITKMSLFGRSTQLLSRCGTTWLRANPTVAPIGPFTAVPLCHGIRHVSTTKSKKAQAMKETAASLTEKAPKASAPAKTRKASTKSTAAAAAAAAAAAVKKETKAAKKSEAAQTRATKTKAAAAEVKPRATKKKAAAVKESPPPVPEATTNTTASTSKREAPEAPEPAVAAAKQKPAAANTSRFGTSHHTDAPAPAPKAESPAPPNPSPRPSPASHPILAAPAPDRPKSKTDPSSPEYKAAARKWTSTMIALPILFVTSYFLFDRLALGNEPNPEDIRRKIRGESSGVNAATSSDATQTSDTA